MKPRHSMQTREEAKRMKSHIKLPTIKQTIYDCKPSQGHTEKDLDPSVIIHSKVSNSSKTLTTLKPFYEAVKSHSSGKFEGFWYYSRYQIFSFSIFL